MSNHLPIDTVHHIRDHCLCLATHRAARLLARRFDEALRALDLTNGQFSLMTGLSRPQPPTIGAVASLLAMDRTTLTANLKPLERRGLVEVTIDPDDRRSRRIALTDQGKALLTQAVPIWRATHSEVDRALGEDTASALRTGLSVLTAARDAPETK
jgi:DNA-binding MarR family transcriptional regulator